MTAREFSEIASGLFGIVAAFAVAVFVVLAVLRYRADRPPTKVGAPPLDPDDDP